MTDCETVVARLRASRDEWVNSRLEDGRTAGEDWARDEAEYIHLVRIAEYREENEIADPDTFIEVVDPDEFDRGGWAEYWVGIAGHDLTKEFVRGFVEGALRVFYDIANELWIEHRALRSRSYSVKRAAVKGHWTRR
jgi:hypothetical protein